MYRVFATRSDLDELEINWSRSPSPLSDSNRRYEINTTFSAGTVNVSITLWDLMTLPDSGHYTVTVCSNCTCANTTFILSLFECDPDSTPQPTERYYTKAIAETSLPAVLMISVVFVGSTDHFLYDLYWYHKDGVICTPSSDSEHFSCKRPTVGNCTFRAKFYIHEPSYMDSGNYTVQVVGRNGHISNNSTYHVGELYTVYSSYCNIICFSLIPNQHFETWYSLPHCVFMNACTCIYVRTRVHVRVHVHVCVPVCV